MKQRLFAAIVCTLWAVVSFAQNYDYRPRETWPYLNENFTSGVVTNFGGEQSADGFFNICVTDGKLHFIKDGKIMAADMLLFQAVRMGEDVFINRMGRMKQVVKELPGGKFLLKDVSVDMDQLSRQDIGLGVRSAIASTQKVNNIGATVSMELSAAIADAKNGVELPLKEKYSFLLGAQEVEASKNAFLSLPGVDKAAAKAFLKKEKIKWHKTDSLVKVLEYISENL